MATPNGLEPSTSSVTGWRANRLHHRAINLRVLPKAGLSYSKSDGLSRGFVKKVCFFFHEGV